MSNHHDRAINRSKANRASRRHAGDEEGPGASVALPLAVVTVTDLGGLDITVDGQLFPPPRMGAPWCRAGFGDLLDAISEHRMRTVRVVVHESIGSVFTDIIRAGRSRHTDSGPDAAHSPEHALGRLRS